jgi:hypothetical protein
VAAGGLGEVAWAASRTKGTYLACLQVPSWHWYRLMAGRGGPAGRAAQALDDQDVGREARADGLQMDA